MKRSAPDLKAQAKRAALNALKRARRTAARSGVELSDWEGEFLGSVEQTSDEALRRTMDINFFGVWRVTQAVLPILRQQRSGRLLAVSSVGGLLAQPFNEAYCAAKFALEGFYESLAPVAKRLGIHVSLIEPGPVNTEFVANVLASGTETRQVELGEYKPLLEAYMAASRAAFAQVGQTGDDVARVIVQAATEPQPHLRYPTSETVRGLLSRKYVDLTGDTVLQLAGSRLG